MSIDRSDLFHGHVGGIDTLAKAFLVAHAMHEDRALEDLRDARYAGWSEPEGQAILGGERSLDDLRGRVTADNLDPAPVSGAQEALETVVNRYIERVR
jgi:xylose isomerase